MLWNFSWKQANVWWHQWFLFHSDGMQNTEKEDHWEEKNTRHRTVDLNFIYNLHLSVLQWHLIVVHNVHSSPGRVIPHLCKSEFVYTVHRSMLWSHDKWGISDSGTKRQSMISMSASSSSSSEGLLSFHLFTQHNTTQHNVAFKIKNPESWKPWRRTLRNSSPLVKTFQNCPVALWVMTH